jgi:L-ascorbate metabolism protein UlaG (beta-lactamase superfamily)
VIETFRHNGTPIRVRFFGTTTLYFRCSKASLLTDCFFTHPPLSQVLFGKILSDGDKIRTSLSQASIEHLDAVLISHSHYDHVLDAPEVTRQTGSIMIGSYSTALIGRGAGLPESQIQVIQPGNPIDVQDCRITFIESKHSKPVLYPGKITHPLVPPARASEYREGGTYSIHVSSPSGSFLVHGSADMIPGNLTGLTAHTVFLSVAQLSRRPEGFVRQYFDEIVGSTKAKIVFPIHWDDFFKKSGEDLVFSAPWLDHTAKAMRLIQNLCAKNHIQFMVPPYRETFEIP